MDLKEGGLRCDPENNSNTTQCLSNYVQNQSGCRIPTWEVDGQTSSMQQGNQLITKLQKPDILYAMITDLPWCESYDQFTKASTLSNEIHYMNSNEVYNLTGSVFHNKYALRYKLTLTQCMLNHQVLVEL